MKGFATKVFSGAAIGTLLSSAVCLAVAGAAPGTDPKGKWLSGDFHQHTLYTDGSTTFDFVMEKSNQYALDWWANSEHGGARNRDGNGNSWNTYSPNPIKGDYAVTYGTPGVVMARWQSLKEYVWEDIEKNRELYPEKRIFSGLEWNVPGHEHCSTAIIAKDASAISAFEYQFDKSDADKSRTGEATPFGSLIKANKTHADAVRGCQWMQEQYKAGTIDNGWIVFAHIERAGTGSSGGYDINHFRDLNNAGPDVCYGFEGAPGHQANNDRGFGNSVTCDANGSCSSKDFGGSYGGVGYYTAIVGGLWDAMLGEGRRWFNFANSDYHTHYTKGGDDFYPGEYQKNWVYVIDKNNDGQHSLDEIADGMRSGNAYFTQGDLINHLEFEAQNNDQKVSMGGEMDAQGTIKNLKIKIRFKSPQTNNCMVDSLHITSCAAPVVDHIDLIAGEIAGPINPSSPDYAKAVNSTTKVIATFNAKNWERDEDGYNVIVYHLKDVAKNMYFRLRGTNLAANTPYETDESGNPLPDALVTINENIDAAQEAWNDLWFYSNPIFVYVN